MHHFYKEYCRQILHLLLGVCICILSFVYNVGYEIVWILLTSSFVFHVWLKRQSRCPGWLCYVERERDLCTFPAKGLVFYACGVALCFLLPSPLREIAILILAVGDSVATVVGVYFGKRRIPWNTSHTIEGLIAAIVSTSIAAACIATHSYLARYIAVIVVVFVLESLPWKQWSRYYDDNIFLPLVSVILLFGIEALSV